MALLSDEQIAQMLQKTPHWKRLGKEITRTVNFNSFREAVGFVVQVALLAEKLNHHPYIAIHYKTVVLNLMTHSEGGLTEKDFDMAQQIDRIV
ncbi:MAG: 4a-hydroxytetrahydrobiopterin dehydratase [Armatimonadota bacterium]|nr:4a-hydroxytetrahydrobiopterin dehydratase [bacterium]MDW8320946.1 4a-hydroxytetrahydrobiopterin dehydratase [Armatimonadota bacterium]